MNKNFEFKLPNNLTIIYGFGLNVLIIINSFKEKKIFNPKGIFILNKNNNYIKFNSSLEKISSKLYFTRSTLKTYLFFFSNAFIIKKLKLVGIGYRVVKKYKDNTNFLHFRLGYSHDVMVKIPDDVVVHSPKFTTIILMSKTSKSIEKLTYIIKSLRRPDSYKGKGVLEFNEKLLLKKGKKI